MKLMLPLIGLFLFIGLNTRQMTPGTYVRIGAVILLVALVFFFTSPV